MKQKHKIASEEQQQISETHAEQAASREFTTPEELLRHDAAQTNVPPSVTKRLDESLEREPAKTKSFWRRFFGVISL